MTKQWLKYSMVLAAWLILISSAYSQTVVEPQINAAVINFLEYEPGSGEYPVKMTISKDFLRIDDTQEGKDFVLFDRQKKIIYSVSSDNKQIIQINNKPVSIPSPIDLKLSEKELSMDKDAPLIAGKVSRHHQFFVNKKLCYEIISVPGLMPDVVTAMQDFNQVLAGQQAETLRAIPGDLQESCDLSRHTFYPKRYLQKGFPIMEKAMFQDENDAASPTNVSYSRVLINYSQKQVPEARFKFPDYEILPIN